MAAETVRKEAALRRSAEHELRVHQYLLQYYESMFPWLEEFRGEEVDELITSTAAEAVAEESPTEPSDPARRRLTDAEYRQLTDCEKYQLALDRYWSERKTRWEVGRDYERYVGYLYETDGYAVHYQGIVEGFADLGRDLVCQRGSELVVVQCKRWSREKTIHEKHVFQLHGTVMACQLDHPECKARGVLVTSTVLSKRAHKFAALLDIQVHEDLPLIRYPCVKCNVSRSDGSKVYHLPFDQQYDRTIVEEHRCERYVETVAEAERLGFRRALRWRGST